MQSLEEDVIVEKVEDEEDEELRNRDNLIEENFVPVSITIYKLKSQRN